MSCENKDDVSMIELFSEDEIACDYDDAGDVIGLPVC